MMALAATSRDGVSLQGYGLANFNGPDSTSLMGLGADGTPVVGGGIGMLGMLLVGAAFTTGITAWTFAASRDGSNVKPGLIAGGVYLAAGLLMLASR